MNNRFEPIADATEKQEAHETHEAPRGVEQSPAELIEKSQQEVAQFKAGIENDLAEDEARAEKEGLEIDPADKEGLKNLGKKAEVAEEELKSEVEGEDAKEKIPTPEQQKAFNKGKEKVLSLQAAGKDNTSEYFDLYSHITEGFGENLKWRNIEEIDPERINEMLIKLERLGMEMKERIIENPELLSEKEASKKLLAEERLKLAQEIREQRKTQGGRLSRLKNIIDAGQEKIEGEQGDARYGKISELQSAEATSMAERISSEEFSEQDAGEERENMNQLIENSEKLKSIKEKLEEHYVKADVVSRERYDTLNRSLEHVMKRNSVFLIHKIEEKEGEGFRHDENYSNVSVETTYEDDIDIMLALEPSISASSVMPGEKTKVWHGASGFLLGGGCISEAGSSDIRTIAHGIKDRRSEENEIASIQEIDRIVKREGNENMNELVVNNPEIFGFFQHVEVDNNGKLWAESMKTRHYFEEVPGYSNVVNSDKLKTIIANYRKRFVAASQRNIPLYVMTGTREVYEYMGINDDGSVNIGKQLTPEEVATGRAGLSAEKRKEIGERILEKQIFRKQETQEEAREIINSI